MYYVEFLRARKTIYWLAAWLCFVYAMALYGHFMSAKHASHSIPIPVDALVGIGAIVASIVATILGCGLSRENSGHLALAWTKPASRTNLALSMTLIDICAIAVAFALGVALAVAACATFGVLGYVQSDATTPGYIARGLLFPLAWYGITQGVTASMRSRAGAIACALWVASIVLLSFDSSRVLGGIFAPIVSLLDHVNPMYYYQLSFDDKGHNISLVQNAFVGFAGLAALAVVGYAAAIAQWRRLEA